MKRRVVSLLLTLVLLCALLPQTALFASADTVSGACADELTWWFDPVGGVLRIEGSGPMKDFVSAGEAPWRAYAAKIQKIELIDGLSCIGDNAFSGCTALTEASLPDSVTRIGANAFAGCASLPALTLPDTLTEIGEAAFAGCTALETVNFPDGLLRCGRDALLGTAYYENTTHWDNGLLYVGKWLVSGADDAETASVKSGTLGIADYAFARSSMLSSITLPNSLTHVGAKILTGTAYHAKEPNWTFGLLYVGKWLTDVRADTLNATVRSSANGIADCAFDGCTKLNSVSLPSGLTSVGAAAFRDCAALESVVLPGAVHYLGAEAFAGCSSLSGAILTGGFPAVGKAAFRDCGKLAAIEIPNGVETVGDEAFAGCSALASATIPDSVTSIGRLAFLDCVKLSSLSTVSKNVTYIGDGAFAGCQSLTKLSVDANNPNYLSDADGILFTKNMQRLLHFPCGREYRTYTVPDSVVVIGGYAFYGCAGPLRVTLPENLRAIGRFAFCRSGLAGEMTISKNVMRIGEGAFADCKDLIDFAVNTWNNYYVAVDGILYTKDHATLVAVPGGRRGVFQAGGSDTRRSTGVSPTSVEPYALAGCVYLTDVEFPATVTLIGENACLGCESLTGATLLNKNAVIGGEDYTLGFPSSTKLYGHAGSTAETYAKRYNYRFSVLCDTHTWGEWVTVTPATCTAAGSETRTCSVCGVSETREITADHSYGSWTTTKAATCTEAGTQTRTCSVCGTTETQDIAALGHSWGTPSYAWNSDNTQVTATRACTRSGCTVKESEVVKATASTTTASCTAKGTTTYTSEAFKNTAFTKQTKTADTAALGHSWGTATYTWNSDNTQVTGTVSCTRSGCSEKKTKTVSATSKTTATCTVAGKTTYTAVFSEEGFATQTKTVDVAALGHVDANKDGKCDRCGTTVDSSKISPDTGIDIRWAALLTLLGIFGTALAAKKLHIK